MPFCVGVALLCPMKQAFLGALSQRKDDFGRPSTDLRLQLRLWRQRLCSMCLFLPNGHSMVLNHGFPSVCSGSQLLPAFPSAWFLFAAKEDAVCFCCKKEFPYPSRVPLFEVFSGEDMEVLFFPAKPRITSVPLCLSSCASACSARFRWRSEPSTRSMRVSGFRCGGCKFPINSWVLSGSLR